MIDIALRADWTLEATFRIEAEDLLANFESDPEGSDAAMFMLTVPP